MEEIKEKYSWNLKEYYNNFEEFDKDAEKMNRYLEAFDLFKGKLNNKEMLLKYFQLSTQMNKELEKIFMYVYLNEYLDFNNPEVKERKEVIENFDNELELKLNPISNEVFNLSDEFLLDCMKDTRFKNYKMKLEKIMNNKKHILSEKEENIFALMGSFSNGFEEIYTNIMNNDMTFEPVIVDGKEEKLTSMNLMKFYKNKDVNVRKQAFLNYQKSISKRVNSAITAYIYQLKYVCMDLNLRNYTSMLDAVLESDKIPKEVYYKLITKVNDNINFVKEFYAIKKRGLNLDKFYTFDSYLSLAPKVEKKLSIEEQFDIIRKALSPLGENYCSYIDRALKERWFDLYPNDNKLANTFATNCYTLNRPYVFLHQNYDLDSLGALIHELGHAINFACIMENQTIDNAGTPIYVAEIASTTNEILLAEYQYKNTNNLDEKIYYLETLIDNFIGTVIVQTKFSEFEDYAYKLVEEGNGITVDKLCDGWANINKKYYGDVFDKVEEMEKFKKGQGFIAIHHFVQSSYYVFKYATSYSTAYYIATKILSGDNEMKSKYLEFLSKGSSQYANDQIKDMGIDLSTGEAYDFIFDKMNEKLKELDALVELREMRNNVTKKVLSSSKSKEINNNKIISNNKNNNELFK